MNKKGSKWKIEERDIEEVLKDYDRAVAEYKKRYEHEPKCNLQKGRSASNNYRKMDTNLMAFYPEEDNEQT